MYDLSASEAQLVSNAVSSAMRQFTIFPWADFSPIGQKYIAFTIIASGNSNVRYIDASTSEQTLAIIRTKLYSGLDDTDKRLLDAYEWYNAQDDAMSYRTRNSRLSNSWKLVENKIVVQMLARGYGYAAIPIKRDQYENFKKSLLFQADLIQKSRRSAAQCPTCGFGMPGEYLICFVCTQAELKVPEKATAKPKMQTAKSKSSAQMAELLDDSPVSTTYVDVDMQQEIRNRLERQQGQREVQVRREPDGTLRLVYSDEVA